MLIAKAQSHDGPLYLLGLSRKNIEELMEGNPIRISQKSHGSAAPVGLSIGILFGETEHEMRQMLQQAGAITQKTTVVTDPRLGEVAP